MVVWGQFADGGYLYLRRGDAVVAEIGGEVGGAVAVDEGVEFFVGGVPAEHGDMDGEVWVFASKASEVGEGAAALLREFHACIGLKDVEVAVGMVGLIAGEGYVGCLGGDEVVRGGGVGLDVE